MFQTPAPAAKQILGAGDKELRKEICLGITNRWSCRLKCFLVRQGAACCGPSVGDSAAQLNSMLYDSKWKWVRNSNLRYSLKEYLEK